MQAILDQAIERYRREKFVLDANADYAVLRKNSKAWKEELKERELWEQTSVMGSKTHDLLATNSWRLLGRRF